jgi:hypothetical protein
MTNDIDNIDKIIMKVNSDGFLQIDDFFINLIEIKKNASI